MTPSAAAVPKKGKQLKKKKRMKQPVPPPSTDRHWLYQESVQSPEEHIKFFDEAFTEKTGGPAKSLKEDFCGTAFLSSQWVRHREDNIAIGVDLDLPTLDWGREHNISGLSEDELSRLTLHHEDVMNVAKPKVDIVAALNFSYFEFKTRDVLRSYFEHARKSLNPDGVLILDMFGGWEAQMEEIDRTRYDGFTYVWEQKWYDPVNNLSQFFIHFKFHTGGGIEKAFEYNWRLWTMPEIRELLAEAGFGNVKIYWEGIDDDTGEGSGEYHLVTKAESCPGWIAFLVASVD